MLVIIRAAAAGQHLIWLSGQSITSAAASIPLGMRRGSGRRRIGRSIHIGKVTNRVVSCKLRTGVRRATVVGPPSNGSGYTVM